MARRLYHLLVLLLLAAAGCQQSNSQPDANPGAEADGAAGEGPTEFSSWAGEKEIATNDLDELFERAVENYEQSTAAASDELRAEKLLMGAAHARRLASLDPDFVAAQQEFFSTMYYNGACALALQGKPDRAMEALQEAMETGFHDLDLLMLDDDLAPVRASDQFGEKMEAWSVMAANSVRKEIAIILELNEEFAFSFELQSLDGKPLSNNDLEGKVAVVYLWGTWSDASLVNLPHLKRLQQDFPDEVQIIGIHFNEPGGASAVESFLAEHDWTFPAAIGEAELLNQVPQFEDFPTMVFMDRAGAARLRLTGGHSYRFLQAIVDLLSEDSSP